MPGNKTQAKGPSESDQRKLQELMIKSRSYQQALSEMGQQAAMAEQVLMELESVVGLVETLPQEKGDEVLVPIGAGVFVKAKLTDKENFIISVGGDTQVAKASPDAKAYLIERKAKLEEDLNKLLSDGNNIRAELETINKTAEEIYSKFSN